MGEVSYLPSILRAMAKNYADGHCWDHLDSEAVEKSADRIEALEAERNVLDLLCQERFDELAMLKAENAKLSAELSTVKKVAYGNMELLEENAKLRELEHKMDYYTTPQPSAGVVVPERQSPNDEWHYVMRERSHGWNACLDEFARLNGKEAL